MTMISARYYLVQLTLSALILWGALANCGVAQNALYIPDLGTSAQMIALGNIEGFSSSAYSVLESPAGINRSDRVGVSAFTTQLMDEAYYKNMSVLLPTDYGHFGVGYMSVGVDNIPKTALSEGRFVAESFFNFQNYVAKLVYATHLTDDLSIGAAVTYLSNSLGTVSGEGFNGDIGLRYQWGLAEISGQLKNIVTSSKIAYTNGGVEEFPLQSIVGLKLNVGDLGILGQAKFISHQPKPLLSAGLHYNPSFINIFHIYGGYKEFHALQNVENTYTVGLGLSLFDVQFDYAFEKSDGIIFNNHNYFSVSVNF